MNKKLGFLLVGTITGLLLMLSVLLAKPLELSFNQIWFWRILVAVAGANMILFGEFDQIFKRIGLSVLTGLYAACVNTFHHQENIGAYILAPISSMAAICLSLACISKEHHYKKYFSALWGSAVMIVVASFFAQLCWLVLYVWMGLFSLLKIAFFANVFTSSWFMWLVTPIFFSAGIMVSFWREKLVAQLRLMLLTFFQWLLPVLAFICALYFVVSLFKHGFANMLGDASGLLVVFSFLGIIFVNAAYQYGQEHSVQQTWYKSVVTLMLLLMSYFCIQSLFTIPYRFDVTLSISVMYVLMALYCLSYFVCAVCFGRSWFLQVEKINVVLAWTMVVITFLMFNPYSTNAIATPKTFHYVAPEYTAPKIETAGYAWTPVKQLKRQRLVLMGYAYQTPVFLCRAKVGKAWIPGELKSQHCYIVDGKVAKRFSDYDVLTGHGFLSWGFSVTKKGKQPFLFTVKNSGNVVYQVCRGIYHNQIHVGLYQHYRCLVNADKVVDTMNNASVLYI